MARPFRRRMTRGRRPRPMDWVANPESWNWRIRPVVLNPNQNVIDAGYTTSNLTAISLTTHADLFGDAESIAMGVPQLEQTAVRVVGSLYFGLNSNVSPSQVNYRVLFNARIAVATQRPDTLYTADFDTASDLNRPQEANEDFLWHFSAQQVVDTDFWADTQILTPDWRSPQKVPIDVRVSRRLKQREVLVLYGQAALTEVVHGEGTFVFNPDSEVRVWYDTQLRTLVRTIT